MKKKLFVADSIEYASPFLDSFSLVTNIEECDTIMFTGGEDISPVHYKEPVGKFTYCNPARDMYEYRIFDYGRVSDKSFLGICRGAQLLTALVGGKVIQHVANHGISHDVITIDGDRLRTSSLHHQMMWPWQVEHKMLAWSSPRSNTYLNGWNKELTLPEEKEPEVVYYPSIKALCIQGHPEMMKNNSPFVQWCNKQAKELL